jgi:hypothetical protein
MSDLKPSTDESGEPELSTLRGTNDIRKEVHEPPEVHACFISLLGQEDI